MEFTYSIPERLRLAGRICASMGSLFYGDLFVHAATAYDSDGPLKGLLDRHMHRARVGLLLGGAAHFRALHGDAPAIAAHFPSTGGDGDAASAWQAIEADIAANSAIYNDLLAMNVQTNEVARAMPILGALLTVADATRMPLRIFEVGSSAGLLLNLDRYRYSGEKWSWGDPDAAVHLRNRCVDGAPQHLDADLDIGERRGCDVHPLHLSDPVHADRLLSFVWPDQQERLDRLRAAISVARLHPVEIDCADAISWIGDVALPRMGMCTVGLHTVVTEHLSADTRERLRDSMYALGREASREGPFAWVRMEPPEQKVSYETSVTLWPSGEQLFIARSDGHAQDLQWSVRVA